MATHEVDIGDLITATEKEIFDSGMRGQDVEDSGPEDPSGDRSLEQMGEGLEGQQEPDEDESESEDEEGEESEGEEGEGEEQGEEQEGEEEGEEGKEEGEAEEAEPEAETKPDEPHRVPSGRLREQTERAQRAEDQLKALQAERETERSQFRKEFDELRGQMTGLMTAVQHGRPPQPQAPQAPQPEPLPDVFENPQGFGEYFVKAREADRAQFGQLLNQMRVENSLAIAHAIHKEDFAKAFEAANKLPPNTPETRDTVQRIFTSVNPGEALVQWHKKVERDQALGNQSLSDYEQKIRHQEREAMMKDPEFRKQFMSEMRSEAAGEGGRPARTVTRLPKSLNGA